MNCQALTRSIIAITVLTAAAGGIYLHWNKDDDVLSSTNGNNTITLTHTNIPHVVDVGLRQGITAKITDFSSIVENAGPAVVNISIAGNAKRDMVLSQEGNLGSLDPDDLLSQFFKRFGPQLQMPHGPQIRRGSGSGFIISSDGLILTNAHVINGAQEVIVKLTDRREFKARIIGLDNQSDIAVICIDAKSLPTVKIGNPVLTKVGEPVLAIGSPYGFENTATAGIVSAKSRTLPDDNYVPFIQTDVAVNPGNSGGPLFNMSGEVIGINSQIYSQTGGYQGLSFAIPINIATKVERQLIKHGRVKRSHLGVSVQEITQSLAKSFNLVDTTGALVSSVEKDSPAEKGDLRTADVILRFNGQPINRSFDLPSIVADSEPGTISTVVIIRDGNIKKLRIQLTEAKISKTVATGRNTNSQARLGLIIRKIRIEEQQQTGISSGLVVEDVSGPSALAGIQRGDILLSLNNNKISSIQQLRSLVSKSGKNVALLVQRDKYKIFIPLELH